MDRIPILYQGKDYFLLFRYESGYCEIQKEGERSHQVILVHISEIQSKPNKDKRLYSEDFICS
jgi:hypothetical protein